MNHDPYYRDLAARHRIQHLHAEAATRRLIAEQRRREPGSGLRSGLAAILRRAADHLAPVQSSNFKASRAFSTTSGSAG
jgi:hypothetical protein